MTTILRRAVALLALAVGIGVAAGTAPASAATTHTFRSGGHITITQPIHRSGGVKTADDWWF